MAAQAFRLLGRAIDVLPRESLRIYLECAEEVLAILRDHTDWDAKDGKAPEWKPGGPLFGREEAQKTPLAIM
eukprot:11782059-Heterocapsa_arctica.AAC.1